MIKKNINAAFLLMLLILGIGAAGTIYTVYVIGFKSYSEDLWFGYSKEYLELNFSDLNKRIDLFDKLGYVFQTDFSPQVGNNTLSLTLLDVDQNPVPDAKISMFIKRPASFEDISLDFDFDEDRYKSTIFELAAGGTWIMQIKLEIGPALLLKELIYSYDNRILKFVANPDYRQQPFLRFPAYRL